MDSATRALIEGNNIDTPALIGIVLGSGTRITISNNLVYSCGQSGIMLGQSASNMQYIDIIGNIIDTPATAGGGYGGINFSSSTVQFCNIIGNQILNFGVNGAVSSQRGIDTTGAGGFNYFTIVDNILYAPTSGTTSHGMLIRASTTSKGMIRGNIVLGILNQGIGIWLLTSVTDVIVEANYVDGFAPAINESASSNFNIIRNNDVRNNNVGPNIQTVGASTVVIGNLGFNPVAKSPARPLGPLLTRSQPSRMMPSTSARRSGG